MGLFCRSWCTIWFLNSLEHWAKFNLRFVYQMKYMEEILEKWQLNLTENIEELQTALNV